TGGNEIFAREGAVVVAPRELRRRLLTTQKLWGKDMPPAPVAGRPTMTFDEAVTLHFDGEGIEGRHLPGGPTARDAVVWFPRSKVMAMGDLYFAGMFPIFHPEHGGDLRGYLRNVRAVLARIPDDARVIPGHGPVTSKAELAAYARMIDESIAWVSDQM